jgi:hypothetical protein
LKSAGAIKTSSTLGQKSKYMRRNSGSAIRSTAERGTRTIIPESPLNKRIPAGMSRIANTPTPWAQAFSRVYKLQ